MIYIICFFLSVFFIWLGTKHCTKQQEDNGDRKQNKLKKLPVTIGILLPTLLAAFRDTSVGTDVGFYVVPYFNSAVRSISFWKYVAGLGGIAKQDLGYDLLNYIISRFTDDIGWLFFFTELLIIVCIFAGCWILRFHFQPWTAMLFYYLIFYNMTLSTVRQSCACAISFLAVTLALKFNFKRDKMMYPVGLIVLAMTFHATAVFSAILLLICWLVCTNKIRFLNIGLISILGCILFRFASNYFLGLVLRMTQLLKIKYSTDSMLNANSVGAAGWTKVILLGLFVIFIQFFLLSFNKNDDLRNVNRAFLTLNMIYMGGMFFLAIFPFIPRMMYYIQMFWCLPLAQSGKITRNYFLYRFCVVALTVSVVVTYWLSFYIIGGVHGTYPYIFR